MKATGPSQPAQLLLDIMDILHQLGVPCAVVGAFAVSYYGTPRSTTDADATIWLNGTGKSAKDVCETLVNAGYRAKLSSGDFEDPIQGVIVIEDRHENRADLLIGVRGMDPEAQNRCVSTLLLDSPVRIMGAEDLVAMKVFAGGPSDLDDVRSILQVSGAELSLDLLRKNARRYGKDASDNLARLLSEVGLS
jgi:hypothetical protein